MCQWILRSNITFWYFSESFNVRRLLRMNFTIFFPLLPSLSLAISSLSFYQLNLFFCEDFAEKKIYLACGVFEIQSNEIASDGSKTDKWEEREENYEKLKKILIIFTRCPHQVRSVLLLLLYSKFDCKNVFFCNKIVMMRVLSLLTLE